MFPSSDAERASEVFTEWLQCPGTHRFAGAPVRLVGAQTLPTSTQHCCDCNAARSNSCHTNESNPFCITAAASKFCRSLCLSFSSMILLLIYYCMFLFLTDFSHLAFSPDSQSQAPQRLPSKPEHPPEPHPMVYSVRFTGWRKSCFESEKLRFGSRSLRQSCARTLLDPLWCTCEGKQQGLGLGARSWCSPVGSLNSCFKKLNPESLNYIYSLPFKDNSQQGQTISLRPKLAETIAGLGGKRSLNSSKNLTRKSQTWGSPK